jgi:hypothetical protein
MSLLAILDFTLVTKYFLAQLCGFVFVLSTATVWIFFRIWMVLLIIVLGSSDLVVFLSGSFGYHCVWLKGFKSWLDGCLRDSLGLIRALFSCSALSRNCLPFTSVTVLPVRTPVASRFHYSWCLSSCDDYCAKP